MHKCSLNLMARFDTVRKPPVLCFMPLRPPVSVRGICVLTSIANLAFTWDPIALLIMAQIGTALKENLIQRWWFLEQVGLFRPCNSIYWKCALSDGSTILRWLQRLQTIYSIHATMVTCGFWIFTIIHQIPIFLCSIWSLFISVGVASIFLTARICLSLAWKQFTHSLCKWVL